MFSWNPGPWLWIRTLHRGKRCESRWNRGEGPWAYCGIRVTRSRTLEQEILTIDDKHASKGLDTAF